MVFRTIKLNNNFSLLMCRRDTDFPSLALIIKRIFCIPQKNFYSFERVNLLSGFNPSGI